MGSGCEAGLAGAVTAGEAEGGVGAMLKMVGGGCSWRSASAGGRCWVGLEALCGGSSRSTELASSISSAGSPVRGDDDSQRVASRVVHVSELVD
jgi:hypothetical protein